MAARTRLLASLSLLLAAAPACVEEEPEPVDECGPGGENQVAVVTTLTFARADEAYSVGFDLDEHVSYENGSIGCGIEDYVSPDGQPGIDNAFARILPILMATEAQAVEGIIQNTINSGELLILFEMGGLQDRVDDACVDWSMIRGLGDPFVGNHGLLESGQTFDRSADDLPLEQRLALEGGSMIASDQTVRLPIQIFEEYLELVLERASVRVDWHEDGTISGYLGGVYNYQDIIDLAFNSNVDQGLAATLPPLFGANADLESVPGSGECDRISVSLEFTGVSAWFFED